MDTTGPNAEQIEYWNQQAGPIWVAQQARLDALIEPLGLAAMERANVRAGERVLDTGCGTGQTTVALGERVGASGEVLGIDISGPMLDAARDRARAAGLSHVRFEQADGQTHVFDRDHFDLLFSRFGVMFFADPPAAFANLHVALKPDARLAFVCWQQLDRNPWMFEPMKAALKHLPPPERPEPGAPGPFAFADPDRVRGILDKAGFRDTELESLERELTVGGDVGEGVKFVTNMGVLGGMMREAPAEKREAVEREVDRLLAGYVRDGHVSMPCAAWIVTARA